MLSFRTIVVLGALLFGRYACCQSTSFNKEKDLLLAQFDCKTDVDDLHTVAALATLLTHDTYKNLNYHAVAGAYGIQEGLYVPPNELFQLAFDDNWSDAHANSDRALEEVLKKVTATLENGGEIWAADAGQSDFSARWLKVLVEKYPDMNPKQRIHVVQHSDWNEEVTAPTLLNYVKAHADYHKIPDGNAVGNGSPGFRSDEQIHWDNYIRNEHLRLVWGKAVELGNRYNGKEGRYLNESVAQGGLDFSDLSEICYILGLEELRDGQEFFKRFGSD